MGNSCMPSMKSEVFQSPSTYQLNLYKFALVHQSREQYDHAIQCYQMLLQVNPNYAMAYYGIGRCLLIMSDFPNSLENCQKSIDLYPNNKYAYNALGVIYQNINHDQESLRCFQKALEIDPNFSYPFNGLGNLYYARSRFEQAMVCYEKASKLDGKNPLILLNIVTCLFAQGKLKQAERQMIKVEDYLRKQKYITGTNRIFVNNRIKQIKRLLRLSSQQDYKLEY